MKTNQKYWKLICISVTMVATMGLVACGGGGGGDSSPNINTTSAITAFSIPNQTGTSIINQTTHTIQVRLPSSTNSVTALVPTFTSSAGSSVSVGGVAQISGTTSNNFTAPVSYLVTAANGSTTTYAVTTVVAATNTNSLLTYSLAIPGTNTPTLIAGTINPTAQTVSVVMPSGTNVTSLGATFTVSTSSILKVGTTDQETGVQGIGGNAGTAGTPNDFTSPVSYTVNNGGLTATYKVTVTLATTGSGPTPVALGDAGNFALFSKTGMSGDSLSSIVGDVGVNPITSTSITTGFDPLTLSTDGTYATSGIVTGNVYAPNFTAPTPAYVIRAEADMMTAYNDAGARTGATTLDSGDLTGLTLPPGTYSSSVSLNLPVNTTLTLNGGPNDVWIIQVTGSLTTGANSKVALTGGALAKNIFWRLTESLTTGATSEFNGIVLSGTFITLGHITQFTGRLLSQTFITLDKDAITAPQ
jgi:hypothetical protein